MRESFAPTSAGVHDPNAAGRFYLEWEAPSPLARPDAPGLWRVRDSAGRHGDAAIHPIIARRRSWLAASAICEALNARASPLTPRPAPAMPPREGSPAGRPPGPPAPPPRSPPPASGGSPGRRRCRVCIGRTAPR